jgi:hypothetical protein
MGKCPFQMINFRTGPLPGLLNTDKIIVSESISGDRNLKID